MTPIRYEVVGEEDYAFVIEIHESGEYFVSSGTYTSDPPRTGRLTTEQEQQLLAAIEELGVPREHPMPEGATAFQAHLTVGAEGRQSTYAFWEGALEEDEDLKRLVRLLELV